MKNIFLVIVALLVGGCASTPTIKSVAGTYEAKKDGDTFRVVFLENGNSEVYKNGKKEAEGKWKLSKESEIHITTDEGGIGVFRTNKDGSITIIALIPKDVKRVDFPKEDQLTLKKIK